MPHSTETTAGRFEVVDSDGDQLRIDRVGGGLLIAHHGPGDDDAPRYLVGLNEHQTEALRMWLSDPPF